MKQEWLDSQQNAWSYLMLLNDRDYLTKLYATETSFLFQDQQMKELIGNIGVYGSVVRMAPAEVDALGIVDDNTVQVRVYTADGGALVSTRTLVRSGEDEYEMQ